MIEVNLKELLSEGVGWSHQALHKTRWLSFVKTIMKIR
jgi:hypothetical protein